MNKARRARKKLNSILRDAGTIKPKPTNRELREARRLALELGRKGKV